MLQIVRSRPVISGAIVILLGVYFAGVGSWLAVLGGSWYYVIAGLGLIATGVLLILGRRLALAVYGLVWLYTVIWAFGESGLDPWYLMPRLLAPTLLGIYLLMPWVTRRLSPPFGGRTTLVGLAGGTAAVIMIGLLIMGGQSYLGPEAAHSQMIEAPDHTAPTDHDWPFYGHDPGGDRFAAATEITPANVSQLQVAWTNRSGDSVDQAEIRHEREFHSEATPLMLGNTLFTCFPHSVIMAIDATTGRTKWRFDPKAEREGNPYLVCRGVAYYEVDDPQCPRRIYAPIFDARIVALNADDGRPCPGFGKDGFINQLENLGSSPPGFTISTSPPLIINNRMIVGSRIRDNQAVDEPSGVVRAYDPKTGALAWAWDIGRGDDAVPPLPPDQIYTRGTPNVWGAISADPKLNMVYLPLGNATPDYFIGFRRPFDDKYGSSIVALDITSGKQRWSFQTVHHDQWDFDLPVAPSLVDLPGPSDQVIPALLQTTKQGQIFMLNRETGSPIAAVEERPVPTEGAAPGQPVSPTQPFSTGMPSFAPAKLNEAAMWGATPIDQLMCRIEFRRLRYDGIFTPQGTSGIIGHPAFDGVSDWGGGSIDPERKIIVLNTMVMPFTIRLIPRDSAEGRTVAGGNQVGEAPPPKTGLNYYPQYGTPYVAALGPWLGIFRTPCAAPPWGQLSAVDLKTRKLLWKVTLGTSRDTGPFGLRLPLLLNTGAPNIGGTVVTRGGLIFVAATTDQYLRAFDLANGRELWRGRLPAGGQATPMVYTAPDGHQYVVVTAGGHGALETRYGDYTIAFRLP
jgi:quinoprotein glucose dehydrogenase